eukprot:5832343-Pyramimonas_sp.AAC.1
MRFATPLPEGRPLPSPDVLCPLIAIALGVGVICGLLSFIVLRCGRNDCSPPGLWRRSRHSGSSVLHWSPRALLSTS